MIYDTSANLNALIEELKKANLLPSKIEITRVGPRYWVSSHNDSAKLSTISENVFSGMAYDKHTALAKSLVEFVERRAILFGKNHNYPSCAPERSDGCAALPKTLKYPISVRDLALNEAIERYCWAKWWDDTNVLAKISNYSKDPFFCEHSEYTDFVANTCDIRTVYIVLPQLSAHFNSRQPVILIAQLNSGGFICGGSCNFIEAISDAYVSALDELLRHGLAFKKMKELKVSAATFYEKRLWHFASGDGAEAVLRRLSCRGTYRVEAPILAIDEEIEHPHSNIVAVHRCYFKNQPLFIGDNLERFCI